MTPEKMKKYLQAPVIRLVLHNPYFMKDSVEQYIDFLFQRLLSVDAEPMNHLERLGTLLLVEGLGITECALRAEES